MTPGETNKYKDNTAKMVVYNFSRKYCKSCKKWRSSGQWIGNADKCRNC